jgi:hypothetical protein
MPFRRRPTTREIALDIQRKQAELMTTVEEVQAALATLTADLEADASAATAEFAKLASELAEKGTEVDLTPLKEAVEGIDAKVKAAKESIPTS